MSRSSWGAVMVTSVLVTGGAGYYIFSQAGKKDMLSMMTVEEAPAVPPANAKPPVEPAPPAEQAPKEEPAAAETKPTRNILFRFPKTTPKSVFITGDFNDWMEVAMTKGPKGWEVSIPLAPGSYAYQFVVDKKHIKDPNNKTAKNGKSIIKVKPLDPKK